MTQCEWCDEMTDDIRPRASGNLCPTCDQCQNCYRIPANGEFEDRRLCERCADEYADIAAREKWERDHECDY
jgi:hypothetical protein